MTDEQMTQELQRFCKGYSTCEGCPIDGICYPEMIYPPMDVRARRLHDMYHAMKSYQEQQEDEK